MFPLNLFLPMILPLGYLSQELPFWVTGVGGAFVVWRVISDLFKLKLPSKGVTGFLSLGCFLLIIFSFDTWVGRDAAGSFLYLLTGLKILEYRKPGESMFLILLGIMLSCTVFLFSLDLFWTLSLGISLLVLLYQMLPLNIRLKSPIESRRLFAKLVLYSMPLTFFLFFFFPRLSNFFGGYQGLSASGPALSGFAERVSPGTISELIKSTKLVFQAEFFLGSKASGDLYWRGEIFTQPNGFSWEKPELHPPAPGVSLQDQTPLPRLSTPFLDYRILLIPQGVTRLFTLEGTDYVHSDHFNLSSPPAGIFKLSAIPEKTIEYFGSLEYQVQRQDPRIDFLALPKKPSKRILDLVSKWNIKDLSPEQKVSRILAFFRENKFKYSLRPPGDGDLTLEQFLFDTKTGFCEHYASSLALLLRISAVPSRVVGGYQGGTFNEFGKFWIVRESDAHAWVEFLNSKNRWTRVDATSVVAPLRLELGAENYFNLPIEIQALKDINQALDSLRRTRSTLESLKFWIEGVNYRWTSWLTNFDLEKQKDYFSRFPFPPQILFILILFVGIFTTFWLNKNPKNFEPMEEKYFREILMWKEFVEIRAQFSTLGPLEILKLTQDQLLNLDRGDLGPQLEEFFNTYIEIAYGSKANLLSVLKSQYERLKKNYLAHSA